jgi:hypothetical protein
MIQAFLFSLILKSEISTFFKGINFFKSKISPSFNAIISFKDILTFFKLWFGWMVHTANKCNSAPGFCCCDQNIVQCACKCSTCSSRRSRKQEKVRVRRCTNCYRDHKLCERDNNQSACKRCQEKKRTCDLPEKKQKQKRQYPLKSVDCDVDLAMLETGNLLMLLI